MPVAVQDLGSVQSRPLEASVKRSIVGASWVWMLILASLAQYRKRDVTDLIGSGAIDSQVIWQLLLWASISLFTLHLFIRKRLDLKYLTHGPLFWHSCFLVIALLSAAYSPLPTFTTFRAGQNWVALLLICAIVPYIDRLYIFAAIFIAINWILVGLGYLNITFGLSWITAPEDSIVWTAEPVWRFASAFGHPTQLGVIAALGALLVPVQIDNSKKHLKCLWGVFFVASTLLSFSRTAVAGLLLAQLFLFTHRKGVTVAVLLVLFLTSACILISPIRSSLIDYLSRGQSADELESMTGRVPIYEDALERIKAHFLIGEGFGANRIQVLNAQNDGSGTVHSHNLLLEAASSTGIFGLVFVLATLGSQYRLIHRIWAARSRCAQSSRAAATVTACFIPLTLEGMSDSGWVANILPVTFAFLAISLWLEKIVYDEQFQRDSFSQAISRPKKCQEGNDRCH